MTTFNSFTTLKILAEEVVFQSRMRIMKNLISASILPFCLASFVVAGSGQTGSEPKPNNTPEQEKATSSVRDDSIAKNNDPAASSSPSPELTEIYKVGPGDVLDIRFVNSANSGRSTLFTVDAEGIIDLPIAGGQMIVGGFTTDEIQNRIRTELKRRAIEERAAVSVGVRQYVSHTVMLTGLVGSSGTRVLRREAVPLYVILAESQLRNDAESVVIMRGGSAVHTLRLSDPVSLNTTVINGDVITVGRSQEFYYIAGPINYPGQKNFQAGITLLQAILAAGGTARHADAVDLSREGAEGRLTTTRFRLKQIKAGKVNDPKLQAGDRIEVLR
jgi:protein involved in polysaccharide export with SLBB domain